MNIQLIQGEFSSNDAIDLMTQMVHIKIKYHENKINSHSSEDDIKTKLKEIGIENAKVELVYSPAWTTDWISDVAKEKLRVYGIAPPDHPALRIGEIPVHSAAVDESSDGCPVLLGLPLCPVLALVRSVIEEAVA